MMTSNALSRTGNYHNRLQVRALAELECRRRVRERTQNLPDTWQEFVGRFFSDYVYYDFADYHRAIFDWAWRIEDTARSLIAILPRGFGKSTIAELVVVMMGAYVKRH